MGLALSAKTKAPEVYLSGSFVENGAYPTTVSLNEKNLGHWASWGGSDDFHGKLETEWFDCPSEIRLYLCGYPLRDGNQLILEIRNSERPESIRRIQLKANKNPRESWILNTWNTTAYRGKEVRIVAIDDASGIMGWFGVSNILHEPKPWVSFEFSGALLWMYVGLCFHWIFWILPGVAVMVQFSDHPEWSLGKRLTMISVVSGLLAYLSFFLMRIDSLFGSISIGLLYAGVVFLLIRRFKACCRFLVSNHLVLLLPLIVAGVYFSFGMYKGDPSDLAILAQNRYLDEVAADNVLPSTLAKRVIHENVSVPFFGDWLSSDRPPLQTGFILWQRFFLMDVLQQGYLIGILCQTAVLWGVVGLFSYLGIRVSQVWKVLLLIIGSGFLLLHSVFVWPKLLAALFALLGAGLALTRQEDRHPNLSALLFGSCFALSTLAHGGSAYSLLAIVIWMLLRWRKQYWRLAIIGVVAFALINAPWQYYKKAVDPPGDRLYKWHMAGQEAIDDRSALETIIDAYEPLSFSDWIENKMYNYSATWGGLWSFQRHLSVRKWHDTDLWRKMGFYHLDFALGVFLFGFLAMVAMVFRQSGRQQVSRLLPVLIIGLMTWFVWGLIAYGIPPSRTVLHHGSFAMVLMLMGALGYYLSKWPQMINALLVVQWVILFWVWVLDTEVKSEFPSELMATSSTVVSGVTLIGAALFTALLVWLMKRLSSDTRGSNEPDPTGIT